MSIANRFWVWRYPIGELWVPAGTSHRVVFCPRGPEYGPSATHFEWPLSYDNFTTGPNDYSMPSNEAYCPCGVTLPDWDGTAGHLLRIIDEHCDRAGHPKPRHEP